jgi:uncharacterized membrane protein YfcA
VPLAHHILAGIVVAIGAMVQGSVGFGLGMFSVPLLVLIDPRFVPGPLLCVSIALTVLLTRREWHSVRVTELKWAIVGRVLGIGAAMAALEIIPSRQIGLLFGALVLAAVLLSVSGLRLAVTPRSLFGAGVLSGFMGTTVSIGGPPIALLYQHQSGSRIRGNLSAYFVIGVSMSLVGLHFIGMFGMPEFLIAVSLLPGVLVGFLVSRHTAGALDRGYVRTGVLLVSAASALAVLIQHLF